MACRIPQRKAFSVREPSRSGMELERRRCTVSCILVALCIAQSEARPSRMLSQVRLATVAVTHFDTHQPGQRGLVSLSTKRVPMSGMREILSYP